MTTVLSAFQTLSLEDRALGFTHANLSVVARQTKKKQNEVEEFFARFLLQNFSLGPPFSHHSEKLHRIYCPMRTRYLAIVDALLHGKDIEYLPEVQRYLAGFSHTKNKSEIITSETARAVLSHDEVVSFPEIYLPAYSTLQVPPNRFANHLFACIDRKKGIPFIEVSNIARFFYKHVALYRLGKILVWRDLFVEWVTKSGKVETIGRIEDNFPYSWLRKIPPAASDASTDLSFQEYVYAETIAVLESHIGFPLDEDFRKQILEQMKDDNFRRHLVFSLGHFSYLLQTVPARTNPAFQWLVAIRSVCVFSTFLFVFRRQEKLAFSIHVLCGTFTRVTCSIR
ncbi:MAG: hypothetical protein KR126chlam3_00514 [Chlamydiae bacterium]|nr:hypothetical protein [Chlamydiota bacterium]